MTFADFCETLYLRLRQPSAACMLSLRLEVTHGEAPVVEVTLVRHGAGRLMTLSYSLSMHEMTRLRRDAWIAKVDSLIDQLAAADPDANGPVCVL